MKKIKIVNIVSRMIYGGVESVIYNYYSNMNLEQFELYIITRKDSKKDATKKFEDIGFKMIYVDDWEKKPIKACKEIMKILEEYKFDIIHSHLSHTNFYFMMLAKLVGIPVRISHSHLSLKDKGMLTKIKHKIYVSLIKKFATDFVACGEDAALNLYGSKSNVIIFNNAIKLEKYMFNQNIRDKYRKEFNISDDTFCVCNIGRMTYQKNQIFLIDIFYEISKMNKNSKLILVGDGELKEEIETKIKEYSLEEDVIILNNRNDVSNLLSMIDVFCLPSLYEGLPVVGVEAQAAGVPCYFSDTIDLKVKICNNCEFISLSNTPKEWAESILKSNNQKKHNNYKHLSNAGFNIKIEAKKLEEYYKNKTQRGV